MLSIQHGSYLFQRKGVLLDGQGTVDSANPVGPAQGGVGGKRVGCVQLAHQLSNIRHIANDLICYFKRRIFIFHTNTSQL